MKKFRYYACAFAALFLGHSAVNASPKNIIVSKAAPRATLATNVSTTSQAEIKKVQKALGLRQTGKDSLSYRKAISDFQRKNRGENGQWLAVDGIAGNQTKAVLFKDRSVRIAKLPEKQQRLPLVKGGQKAKPSFYYVRRAQNGNAALKDTSGRALTYIRPLDKERGEIEGTISHNNVTYNVDQITYHTVYVKVKGKKKRQAKRVANFYWKRTSSEYGLGLNDIPLIPFKAIAVPHAQRGRSFFIPETFGMETPFDLHHDGIWFGYDKGGAIDKGFVDLFTGKPEYVKYLRRVGIEHHRPITMIETNRYSNYFRTAPKLSFRRLAAN